jgi:hypothetical protein
MRLLGQILLACLVLAALQGILAVLAVGIVLALVVGAIWRPAETLPLLVIFAVLAGLDAHPWATIGAIGALFGVWLITGALRRMTSKARHAVALLPPPTRADEGE